MSAWRDHYEPWFKAWLVLVPLVGFGSYRLMQIMWRRTWAVMNGVEQSAFSTPPPPPDVSEPDTFVYYGIGAVLIFSVFWWVTAKLYIHHSPRKEKEN